MILVTGGAGYIGSHFVLACMDARRDVVVLDDLSTGFRDAVPAGIPFVQGDVGDPNLLHRVTQDFDIKAVVHFAAKVVVSESMIDPLGCYDVNSTKTQTLLSHCINAGIMDVVFSSTAAVYGPPCDGFSVSETAQTHPISPYGRSKLIAEWMLADAASAHDLRYVALRYFNVAGADPEGRAGLRSPNATHLLKRVCEVATGKRSHLEIYGTNYDTPDGTCIRDFIHVSDLANAHLHALDYLAFKKPSVVLNCGYGKGVSVRQALDASAQLTGRALPHRVCDRRPGDIAAIIADPTLIKKTFDWAPRFQDLDTILNTAIRYEARLSASLGKLDKAS